jgi:hypothetical protein
MFKVKENKMETTGDAKVYLESKGFPCFYGETLSYVQIANIFKNKNLGKINENEQSKCKSCGDALFPEDTHCSWCGQ